MELRALPLPLLIQGLADTELGPGELLAAEGDRPPYTPVILELDECEPCGGTRPPHPHHPVPTMAVSLLRLCGWVGVLVLVC